MAVFIEALDRFGPTTRPVPFIGSIGRRRELVDQLTDGVRDLGDGFIDAVVEGSIRLNENRCDLTCRRGVNDDPLVISFEGLAVDLQREAMVVDLLVTEAQLDLEADDLVGPPIRI